MEERAFGEHEVTNGAPTPFVYPELSYAAQLLGTSLDDHSNGATLKMKAEIPATAATAIGQMRNGVTLEWQDEHGDNGRVIGVGGKLVNATQKPDADDGWHLFVTYQFSEASIPSALGIIGAAIQTHTTRGRLAIRTDQETLGLP